MHPHTLKRQSSPVLLSLAVKQRMIFCAEVTIIKQTCRAKELLCLKDSVSGSNYHDLASQLRCCNAHTYHINPQETLMHDN